MRFAFLQFISVIFLSLYASMSVAAQNVRAAPDGSVGFNVSTSAVTRLSVRHDRIRRIILDDSAFEMSNDSETGDVFFRVTRQTDTSENGYVITESGHTIGFTLQPTSRVVEPVIISLVGVESPASSPSSTAAVSSEIAGRYVDDLATNMTEVMRKVAADFIVGRSAPSGRNGTVLHTLNGSGWRAQVLVAAAGPSGRLVREQDFYGAGVMAVWVLQNSLPANARTFVVVVKKR